MAETITPFTLLKPSIQTPNPLFSSFSKSLKQCSSASRVSFGGHQIEDGKSRRASRVVKVKALPDWPLMAVMWNTWKDKETSSHTNQFGTLISDVVRMLFSLVDTFYIMFTCWGCCFFGSTKDPYYDSEAYRKDGGDGTGHWVYEKQDDIEESARAELWREELIEEIEQKVGGLRELEEAGKKEEILK
ncbi:UNVERIFIED_CONTAM: Photosynthetic NDH subunit of subcomplex B 4, chloroplastic [Sesamum latifolium]|uniref:Photosynthetic NDH subunit of subcomplex B 4, chloroplastic n=1 Tax=Sesamum latifolium TaxID=2727402 RepID=A0AAW2UI88_9LAMI